MNQDQFRAEIVQHQKETIQGLASLHTQREADHETLDDIKTALANMHENGTTPCKLNAAAIETNKEEINKLRKAKKNKTGILWSGGLAGTGFLAFVIKSIVDRVHSLHGGQ